MYQLYYYPLNASMAPHLVLEELGLDYELIKVDRNNNQHKSAEYLALNPAGRIPTLVENGKAIFESPAICLHLAENYPEAKLVPTVGEETRPLFLQWMMYLTNTLQAALMVYFYPEKHTNACDQVEHIVSAQEQRITDMLALLDQQLIGKRYLLGEQLSICDYYLFMLCVWADEITKPPLHFAHLSDYLKRLAQRKAVKVVCEKEGLSLADYL